MLIHIELERLIKEILIIFDLQLEIMNSSSTA